MRLGHSLVLGITCLPPPDPPVDMLDNGGGRGGRQKRSGPAGGQGEGGGGGFWLRDVTCRTEMMMSEGVLRLVSIYKLFICTHIYAIYI